MKRIFILMTALMMIAICCACGEEKVKKLPADTDAVTDTASDAEAFDSKVSAPSEEKQLVLKHDADYAVVAKKNREIKITSTEDFANYTVGYIDETDSMTYAMYYDFKETVMYNAANDAQAGLSGDVDLVIISRAALDADCEIVWDFANQ